MEKPKPSKRRSDYAAYRRTELNLRYLGQKYRKAHEWLPRLAAEAPGLTGEEVLEKLRGRMVGLRAARIRHRKARLSEAAKKARLKSDPRRAMPVRAIRSRERTSIAAAGSPGSRELTYVEPMEHQGRRKFTDQPERIRGLPSNWLPLIGNSIDGLGRASGFREYIWASPDNDDTVESHMFFPYGAGSDPYDFNGATGLQFLADIEVQPNLLWDDTDSIGFAGILQYTLPEAPWDGAVQWCARQSFDLPEVTCNADWGYFSLVSCARQSPSGEGFPASDSFVGAFSLEDLLPLIWAAGEDFSSGPFTVEDSLDSGFPVAKGQRPRIYLGFAIVLMARDGSVSLGDPNMAYHFCPGAGAGVSYTMVRL